MFKGTSGENLCVGVQIRNVGNDTGLVQHWGLPTKVCGQTWSGKWDGGEAKDLRRLFNV